jgi:hypothetical protein
MESSNQIDGMVSRIEAAVNLYRFIYVNKAHILGAMRNQLNQLIVFVEDPIEGEDETIICTFPELKLAFRSDFYELNDMMARHGEYAPCYRAKDARFMCYFQMEIEEDEL